MDDPNYFARVRLFLECAKVHTDDRCMLWPYRHDGPVPVAYLPSRNGEVYKNGTQRGRVYNCAVVVLEDTGRPRPSKSHTPAHSCGNDMCIAPAHLSWRLRQPYHKVPPDRRPAIAADVRSCREIARDYGVSRQQIWKIKRGKP